MKFAILVFGLLSMSCAGFAQGCNLSVAAPASLPAGYTGTSYSLALTAFDACGPLTWSVASGTLPAGLTMTSAGVIAGIPTATGISTFGVNVTDTFTLVSQTFTLSISLAPFAITSPSTLPSGLAERAYSTTLAATGGIPPYTWTVATGTLPPGLSLSSGGVISGTPSLPEIATFTVNVTYGALFFASQPFTLTIGSIPVGVATPPTLPFGAVGTAYSQTLTAAYGVPPYTWSVTAGVLPPGLALSRAGAITGIPTATGNYIFTAQAQDSTSETASQAFSLTVTAAGALPRLGIFSQVVAGGGWTTTIWLINRTSAVVQASLVFHGDEGSALTLPLHVTQAGGTQEADAPTLSAAIGPNSTLGVATETLAAETEGWADVLSSGNLSGFAVFSNGTAEAAVPLQGQIGNSISLPFDNTNGASTGVALVNLAGAPASITATVWDQSGNQIAAGPVTLTQTDANGDGHDSFMLPSRLAVTAGKRGVVQFQGNPGSASVPAGQLTGLGLRAEASGLFTSIPTIVP